MQSQTHAIFIVFHVFHVWLMYRCDSFRSKTVDNIVQNECKIKGQYLTVKMHLFVLQKL